MLSAFVNLPRPIQGVAVLGSGAGVVSAGMARMDAALEMRQCPLEQRQPLDPALQGHPREPVTVLLRESPGELLLRGGEEVHGQVRGVLERSGHRGGAVHADEDERGVQRKRREGGRGHAMVRSRGITHREHDDAGGESTECGAEA